MAPDLSNFQSNTFDFEFINDFTKISCYHYYGKHKKSSFKIICNIENTEISTVKKAIARIKKAIAEAKQNCTPLHGCTDYLPTI
jgi:hypothetical protein